MGVVRSKLNTGTLRSVLVAYSKFCKCNALNWFTNNLPRLAPADFVKVCSFVNTWVKINCADSNPRSWLHFIDLQTLVGYPHVKDRIFKDDLKNWLCGDLRSGYFNEYVEGMRKIIKIKTSVINYYSFEEFLYARHTWMNSGACRFSKLSVDDEKRKTKFGFALSSTDADLRRAVSMKTVFSEGLRAFIKSDERGPKGRYIVNAPFGLFIRQKYLFEKLRLKCSFDSRLTMFEEPASKNSRLNLLQESYSFAIPLDESSFDYHVTTDQWEAFFSWLQEVLPEDKSIISELKFALGNLDVKDVDGKIIGK